jgi:predicted transcriptional regulator
MDPKYLTLKTIYNIVKNDHQPSSFLISQREIIVRQSIGWDVIQQHLNQLVEEELIVIKMLGTPVVSITQSGIAMFSNSEASLAS